MLNFEKKKILRIFALYLIDLLSRSSKKLKKNINTNNYAQFVIRIEFFWESSNFYEKFQFVSEKK